MYKLLIAEDEEIERKALEMLIKSHYSDLELLPAAENGAELLVRVEQECPDILLVDINMPELDGLSAIAFLRLKHEGIKIIITTAYSDFSYARKAMEVGALDYLLKPLKRNELFRAIEKAIGLLGVEEQQVDRELKCARQEAELHQMTGEELLSSIILGELNIRSVELYFREQEFCGAAMLLISRERVGEAEEGMEKLYYEAVAAEALRYCSCIAKQYRNQLYLLLFPDEGIEAGNYRNWISGLWDMLCARISRLPKMPLKCGVSSWKETIEDLAFMAKECRLALTNGSGSILEFYGRPVRSGNPFSGKAKEYIRKMEKGEWKSCEDDIHCILEKEATEIESFRELQTQVLELVWEIYEKLISAGDIYVKYKSEAQINWNELMECRTREAVGEWAGKMLRQIYSMSQEEHRRGKPYVERAILFMEQNYREDIDLARTAEYAGVSTFYLSRLLKQELDRNYVELLTSIRIHQALRLLHQDAASVKDIVYQSGFTNVSYFYKTFKKVCGINVGEYRELSRGKKGD